MYFDSNEFFNTFSQLFILLNFLTPFGQLIKKNVNVIMDIIVVTVTKLSLHNYTLSLSPNSHCTIICCHCYQILTAQLYFVTVTKLSLHNYMLPLSPNCHCTIIRCHCHQILTAQLCNLCHCHKILTAQLCNCCHCHKILTAQL